MSNSKVEPTEILSDSPITDESQDLLRRVPFVEALCREIINLPFEDSFCFGLYGNWGEGKTSILNLIKNKIKDDTNIVLFEFDPWYLATKEAILKNFLEGFERKLRPVSAKFKKVFKKYFRKLSLGASLYGIGGQIGWEFEKEGLLEHKEKINSLIKKSGKKVLILIDDIDRLQPDEILAVFKLVKLFADFKHTIFILSFDPEAVKSSLQKQTRNVDYTEKIIQKPISLPKTEQGDIDRFLDIELENLFERLNLGKQRVDCELKNSPYNFPYNFSYVYQQHAKKLFTTLRSVKRYINSLSSSLPPVIEEVHLFDFLILEIIKVFAPRIYTDIYENWQFYVPQRTSDESERWLNPIEDSKGQEKETIVKEHIEQLLQSEPQKEVFTNLLDPLFPRFRGSEKDARREKRIYSTSFLKYFTLRVPSQELPDTLVKQTISSWNEAPPERLLEAITDVLLKLKQQEKLIEFFMKLSLFKDRIDQKVAPSLIRSIYKNSSEFSKEDGGLLDSEFHTAERIIAELLKDKIDKSEVQSILEEIMLSASSLDFASGVYILCYSTQKNYPDPKWEVLPSIRKTLTGRFKSDFIGLKRDFFKSEEPYYVLAILWDLCAEEEKVDPKECTCAKYVEYLLDANPKYIGKVLNSYVNRPFGRKKPWGDMLSFNPRVKEHFDTGMLYKRIVNDTRPLYTTDEEREAVELFRKMHEESMTISKDKGS